MYCKIHKTQSGEVLAACDKELVGKTLKDGAINFHVSEKFYRERELSVEELAGLLREHGNINLVGEKAVSVALKEELVDERSIIKISKVPHVQIFKI